MIPIKPITNSLPSGASSHKLTGRAIDAVASTVQEKFLSPGVLNLSVLPPLSLYIHFPWCVKKCPYCDFNSHEANSTYDENAYLDAVRNDLVSALPLIWGRKIYTIFIGGGTPSLMSAAGLDRLMSDVRSLLPIDANAEVTMEANPGTFETEKFTSFRASGINRLSIGIQSFNSKHLSSLGRIHNGDEAKRAIAIAQNNFENINLDLMFALPTQSLKESIADLETALSFDPNHLSLYHLTLEPNTLFAKFPPPIPDDDLSAEMQEQIQVRMQRAGYVHYEVSAFAKPGRESRHNLNYWNFGDYLGVGAGAHSKISFPHRIIRQARFKQPKTFIEHALLGDAVHESTEIPRDDLGFEFMLNALRLNGGVASSLFYERTGVLLSALDLPLQIAEKRGLLVCDHQSLRPTDLGRRFLNDLQQIFLGAPD